MRDNPFKKGNYWYWFDETGDLSKPYPDRASALYDLNRYIAYLNGEPL